MKTEKILDGIILQETGRSVEEIEQGIGGGDFSGEVRETKTGQGFSTSPSFSELVDRIQRFFIFSRDTIKLLLSVYIANNLEGNPVWLLFVSPPSSGKTELLLLLKKVENCRIISEITPQTLISGVKTPEGKNTSLLLKLPKSPTPILLIKDFTTILELRAEKRSTILSQFRDIYDGYYTKAFGTGECINWEGKIGILGGVTQVWETYYSASQILGERFILYRINYTEKDKELVTLQALDNQKDIQGIRSQLEEEVKCFLDSLSNRNIITEFTREQKENIIKLANFVAKSRSQVMRDGYKREVNYIFDEEMPTRIAGQLIQLLKGLILIEDNREENNRILRKVALDCIPERRRKILNLFLTEKKGFTLSHLSRLTKYPETTLRRVLEDLEISGFLEKEHKGVGITDEWFMKEEWRDNLSFLEDVERWGKPAITKGKSTSPEKTPPPLPVGYKEKLITLVKKYNSSPLIENIFKYLSYITGTHYKSIEQLEGDIEEEEAKRFFELCAKIDDLKREEI